MKTEDNKTIMTQIEYDCQLKRYNELKKTLSDISKSKIKAAYNDPGNTWHDNFAYEQLDLQEDGLLNRINELMTIINNAKIIKPRGKNDGKVDIYDDLRLLFIYADDDSEEVILSLGKELGDNSITLNSPLGQAVYNKEYGTTIDYKVNDNNISVKIIEKVNL